MVCLNSNILLLLFQVEKPFLCLFIPDRRAKCFYKFAFDILISNLNHQDILYDYILYHLFDCQYLYQSKSQILYLASPLLTKKKWISNCPIAHTRISIPKYHNSNNMIRYSSNQSVMQWIKCLGGINDCHINKSISGVDVNINIC